MENGQCPAGVFCAFVCTDHDFLLEKFEKIGIRGIPMTWSFLRQEANSGSVIVKRFLWVKFWTQFSLLYTWKEFADDSVFVTSDTNTI